LINSIPSFVFFLLCSLLYINWDQALIGTFSQSQAQRNPEEEGDYMAFEQLVAEAAAKKEKKKSKEPKKSSTSSQEHARDVAADAPNVPRS
jgi:hypothetical protein